jgi:hypothetical protein
MQIKDADGQRSRDYLQVRNGTGDIFSEPGAATAAATYRFQVPESGSYVTWGRVPAAGVLDDSFWLSVDGGP